MGWTKYEVTGFGADAEFGTMGANGEEMLYNLSDSRIKLKPKSLKIDDLNHRYKLTGTVNLKLKPGIADPVHPESPSVAWEMLHSEKPLVVRYVTNFKDVEQGKASEYSVVLEENYKDHNM